MQIKINYASQFRDAFNAAGRGQQFSYDALGLLFDYFEEIEPDMELDVVAICCEYIEATIPEIARDYSIDIPAGATPEDEWEIVVEWLNENTFVVGSVEDKIVYASSF